MSKCRAAVLVQANKPLEIREFEIPRPAPGEVLVEMEMAGICDVDARRWRDPKTPVPMIFGHENVGRISEFGSGTKVDAIGQEVEIGDRVVFGGVIPCGQCYNCVFLQEPANCTNGVRYGGSPITGPPYLRGGYAEYVHLVSKSGIVKVAEKMGLEKPLLAIAGHKALVAGIERIGGISPTDTVLIQGTLPHSIAAVTQARLNGARRVIIMGPSSKRLAVARDLGADVTIDMSSQQAKTPEDRVRLVFDSTEGHGADVIIDTSGIPGAIDEGLRMARPGGKYLVMGQATDYGTSPINTTLIMRKQLRIFGSFSGLPKHLHKAILELERADIPVDKLVTHRFHLDEATTGLEAVDRFESIFAVLEYR
ncbi:MAG TPA: zinc-binding dehydrogenase [Nitrososphaerales archaeon]|nr:zinc-binding dehydrogenase [Nitrososphaerales archaeon]